MAWIISKGVKFLIVILFLARHFQFRVEEFFTEIIIDGPLGKVKYHAIRVEFQYRGSPHSFLWVICAPVLTKDTKMSI